MTAVVVADSQLNYNRQEFPFSFSPVTSSEEIIFRCRIEDLGLSPGQVFNQVGIARSTIYTMQQADTSKKPRILIDSEVIFRLMKYYRLTFGELYEIYELRNGLRGSDRTGQEMIYKGSQSYLTSEILLCVSKLHFESLLSDRLKEHEINPQKLFGDKIINKNTFYALESGRAIDRIDSKTAANLMKYFNCDFFDLFRMKASD